MIIDRNFLRREERGIRWRYRCGMCVSIISRVVLDRRVKVKRRMKVKRLGYSFVNMIMRKYY